MPIYGSEGGSADRKVWTSWKWLMWLVSGNLILLIFSYINVCFLLTRYFLNILLFSKTQCYSNLCKFMQNHKKCFFSFISRPTLIVIALFGRAELRTLNFYTEFFNFAPLINYGNLCKFIPKITKIASSTFLDRFSFCLFYLIGLGGCFKTCTQNFEIN